MPLRCAGAKQTRNHDAARTAGSCHARQLHRLDLQHSGELGDNLQPRIARALLQLAQISAVDGHGCSEVDGLGSFWLAGRQGQAGKEKFAVLRVSPWRPYMGHDSRGDGP